MPKNPVEVHRCKHIIAQNNPLTVDYMATNLKKNTMYFIF